MHQLTPEGLSVLILAPLGQDGDLVTRLLSDHDISSNNCRDMAELAAKIRETTGAVLLTEEAIDNGALKQLSAAVEEQSPWLDLPILVFADAARRGGWPPHMEQLQYFGNVTFIDRPVRTLALVSAVRVALRSRRRQLRLKLISEMTRALVAEGDPERLLQDVWQVLKRGLPIIGYRYLLRTKGGYLKPVRDQSDGASNVSTGEEIREEPFKLAVGNEQLGILTFLLPGESHLKSDERAMLRIVCDHIALSLRRVHTSAELQRRADELSLASRRKDEFLAMLGHELRNPLSTLSVGIELLRQSQVVNEEAIQQMGSDPLEIIGEQTRHITRLVDDLLDVSRITRGRIELRPACIDLAPLLRDVVTRNKGLISERNHTLENQIGDGPYFIHADSTRIRQVFENLYVNAIKYTDPGGTIGLHAESTVFRGGPAVLVKIYDNGIGLSEEMQKCIFDLFVQDGRSLDRAQGGLGIGLTLVQKLVQLHDGHVEVHSDGRGTGSEFRVWLPLWDNPVNSIDDGDTIAEKQEERTTSGIRVLIVEDLTSLGLMTQKLVEKLGHAACLVESGKDALAACREFTPDLVLLDIGLPDMDGYQVARQLLKELKDDCPRLIAVTGYGQDEDKLEARNAGFDQHITKPLGYETLKKLLQG
ncbi:hybrid sensor histidine kinase/response regulator [Rubinisphaera brasiliensis]|uniref:histidine kinase n=1 Tax=Rubinisphaera brasiliensis (strain ATCC 49424 / DSM 5305 / JCM 21570 / IAM 15109 / NBRC 103401 / IFAM 1448) TaxID=756272 RepID=F0SGA9_RUBBR|nr:ATP-binding protein [Rubinisphaera brasiliensis]ADY59451.1 histidine kinase [Rubinisphaera brasiliensis DSM 5305]